MRMWGKWGWRSWKTWRNLVITCVVGWVFYVGAMNGVTCYFLRQAAKESPEMAVMPTPLSDSGVADLTGGSTVDAFGYSFRVPWAKISKRTDSKSVSTVFFEGGGRVMFFGPAGQVDTLKVLRNEGGSQWASMQRILRPDEVTSSYRLFEAEMNSSPGQVGFMHSRTAKAREIFLTTCKETFTLPGTTAIHPVAGGGMRGYEAVRSKDGVELVRLRLFDGRDNQVELWLIWSSSDPRGALTQAQINAVVASITIPDKGCMTPGHCG